MNFNGLREKLLGSRKFILFFFLYAIFGWVYEVFLEVVVYKWGFSNRGFLFGPYCPVYGVGSLMFLFFIYPSIRDKELKKKLMLMVPVFVGCMVVATTLELLTSYLMEWATGSWPWQTYVDYDINFQGRIALSPSVRFGLGGVFFLYVVQPIYEKLVDPLNECRLTILSVAVVGVMLVDFVYTLI